MSTIIPNAAARRLHPDDVRYVLRTLARLNGIAHKIDAEDLAPYLRRDLLRYLSLYLSDVDEYAGKLPPKRRCFECGHELDCFAYKARSDARYCSPRCRQKAHRKRVTARTSPATPEALRCDGSPHADGSLAVTPAPPPDDGWPELPECLRREAVP
jgi:hypothetical protein